MECILNDGIIKWIKFVKDVQAYCSAQVSAHRKVDYIS